jgi:hypothetical protein
MTREELDTLWFKAMQEAGDDFTRYRFAALVAAAEREACARVCDDTDVVRFWHGGTEYDDANRTLGNAAAAIRARGEK